MNEPTNEPTNRRVTSHRGQLSHKCGRDVGHSLLPTENTSGHPRPWGHLSCTTRRQSEADSRDRARCPAALPPPRSSNAGRPHSVVRPDTRKPREAGVILAVAPCGTVSGEQVQASPGEGRTNVTALVTAPLRTAPRRGDKLPSSRFLSFFQSLASFLAFGLTLTSLQVLPRPANRPGHVCELPVRGRGRRRSLQVAMPGPEGAPA